jgi:hypothetical protein
MSVAKYSTREIYCGLVRKFSILLTISLAILAMLWGNCLSCPQMADAHSCCHKTRPASADCHTQNLQHFVKAETSQPFVGVLAPTPASVEPPTFHIVSRIVSLPVPASVSTPPLNLRV